MGGGPLCPEDRDAESFALLDLYVEAGGNFLDTANIYGKWLSRGENTSEQVIGKWMKARKNRQHIILATKGGHPNLASMDVPRLSRQEVTDDLTESLSTLGTDRVDVYWLHRDDETRDVAEIMEYLHDFVTQGKVRYVGCSNWKPARIRKANAYAQRHHLTPFIGNQMMWSIARTNRENFADPTMMPMDIEGYNLHRQTGLAAIPYSSQAHGYFEKLSAGTPMTGSVSDLYDSPENQAMAQRIQEAARELSLTVTEVALAFLLFQPFAVFPIIGSRTPDQLVSSLKAGDLPANEAVGAYIRDAFHTKEIIS